ncbi:MAG: hypothetical protein U9O24_07735 [Campylobacterota bacterium]|nr:hypothetical protein [Campylobacterota bacterium]
MKYIIDLIEDVRESIGNSEEFFLTAMLLKENSENEEQLIYAGEAPLNSFFVDKDTKRLLFSIDNSSVKMTIGTLIPPLLILDMDAMMYELKMDVNAQYSDVNVVGFGKNDEEKKYILFIKI